MDNIFQSESSEIQYWMHNFGIILAHNYEEFNGSGNSAKNDNNIQSVLKMLITLMKATMRKGLLMQLLLRF